VISARFALHGLFATALIGLAACNSSDAPSAETPGATRSAAAVPSAEPAENPAPAPAPAPAPEGTSAKTAAASDPIRGKGGLEGKCHARLAAEGMEVIGTNRIEESEAAIEIFVNIKGAEAPWRCLGYKDGTIGEIMYTGSEGAA
jgi:hypothetical protein